MIDWKAIDKVIQAAESILLTTHIRPDGDGLGCEYALFYHFRELNKECRVINHSKLPYEYRFLDNDKIYEIYDEKIHENWISDVDLVIIFDVGDFHRLGSLMDVINKYKLNTLNIDHHPYLDHHPFTYNVVDVNTAATGELIYDYLQTVQSGPISKKILEGIYTAIMTDTGSFRYSNTSSRCHEIAIDCMKAGIDYTGIYQNVYESNSPRRMKLLGQVLNNLQYENNGELAWFVIDSTMLNQAAAGKEDVDGFTDIVRTIRGVEVALMVFQNERDTVRINFRSKGKYIVNEIAQSLGGGGHQFAAGVVINGVMKKVISQVLQTTRKSLVLQSEQLQ